MITVKEFYKNADKFKMLMFLFGLLYVGMIYSNLQNIVSVYEYVSGGLILLITAVYFWYQSIKGE